MALTLSQLIQPQSSAVFLQQLLNGLQGVGNVTQTGTVPQIGEYAGVLVQLGTGTVQAAGPASTNSAMSVAITTSGNVGTGQFNYSLDGGLTYNSAGPFTIPANVSSTVGTYFVPETNITLIFTNGTYSSPGVPLDSASQPSTFIGGEPAGKPLGETYAFSTSIPNFPVTNWPVGGTGRTLVQTDAQALASLDATVTQVIAGGYAQNWIVPPVSGPPPSGWLDLLSQNFYNRLRFGGAQCQGFLQLVSTPMAGPYSIVPGQLTAVSSQGQLFMNLEAFTTTPGGTVLARFGASNIGSSFNSVVSDVPFFQGNPTHLGTGTGTVSFSGTPYNFPSVVVKITTASSGSDNGQFDYSTDGGTTYTGSPLAIGAMAGSPLTVSVNATAQLTFTFSGSANNAVGVFNLGDTYSLIPTPLPGTNTIVSLVNPLPGVTVGNYLQTAPTPVEQLQPGSTGAVAISGIPNNEVVGAFTVTTAGAVGVGKWTYSTSVLSTPTPVTIATVAVAGQMVVPTGSFEVGDTFTYSNGWRTQTGADIQSDPSLAAADQNQWSQLAPATPAGTYQNWALAASPEVVKAYVLVDPVVPGQVDVVLEGANNLPVSNTALVAVADYIKVRSPLTVAVNVQNIIPISFTVTTTDDPQFECAPGSRGSVSQAVNLRLSDYQATLAPGGFIDFLVIKDLFGVAGTPGGIPGLLNIATADFSHIFFGGYALNAPPQAITVDGITYFGIALAPYTVASITPPPAASYGTFS